MLVDALAARAARCGGGTGSSRSRRRRPSPPGSRARRSGDRRGGLGDRCRRVALGGARVLARHPLRGGHEPAHAFFVADADRRDRPVEGRVNIRMAPDDLLLSFPMGERRHARILGVVRDADLGEGGELPEALVRSRIARGFTCRYSLVHVVRHLPPAPPASRRDSARGDASSSAMPRTSIHPSADRA